MTMIVAPEQFMELNGAAIEFTLHDWLEAGELLDPLPEAVKEGRDYYRDNLQDAGHDLREQQSQWMHLQCCSAGVC